MRIRYGNATPHAGNEEVGPRRAMSEVDGDTDEGRMADAVLGIVADILLPQIAQADVIPTKAAFEADEGTQTGQTCLSPGLRIAKGEKHFRITRQGPSVFILGERHGRADPLAYPPAGLGVDIDEPLLQPCSELERPQS